MYISVPLAISLSSCDTLVDCPTTANVPATQLVYDVLLIQTLTGVVTRVLEGQIFVSPGVTKP